jgi:hypothetical protein
VEVGRHARSRGPAISYRGLSPGLVLFLVVVVVVVAIVMVAVVVMVVVVPVVVTVVLVVVRGWKEIRQDRLLPQIVA